MRPWIPSALQTKKSNTKDFFLISFPQSHLVLPHSLMPLSSAQSDLTADPVCPQRRFQIHPQFPPPLLPVGDRVSSHKTSSSNFPLSPQVYSCSLQSETQDRAKVVLTAHTPNWIAHLLQSPIPMASLHTQKKPDSYHDLQGCPRPDFLKTPSPTLLPPFMLLLSHSVHPLLPGDLALPRSSL